MAEKSSPKNATSAAGPLEPDLLQRIDACWRAANYLSVGQIHLLDNPLLRKPLARAHVKPPLLGHRGTLGREGVSARRAHS
jgi:xylulose-5-phosphate/fructose-6-phosphate phosphoketolase